MQLSSIDVMTDASNPFSPVIPSGVHVGAIVSMDVCTQKVWCGQCGSISYACYLL
jgi:hypothetical protein